MAYRESNHHMTNDITWSWRVKAQGRDPWTLVCLGPIQRMVYRDNAVICLADTVLTVGAEYQQITSYEVRRRLRRSATATLWLHTIDIFMYSAVPPVRLCQTTCTGSLLLHTCTSFMPQGFFDVVGQQCDVWQRPYTNRQGSCGSLKVLEFFFQIFKAWKVLENIHGPWKSLNLCLKSLKVLEFDFLKRRDWTSWYWKRCSRWLLSDLKCA